MLHRIQVERDLPTIPYCFYLFSSSILTFLEFGVVQIVLKCFMFSLQERNHQHTPPLHSSCHKTINLSGQTQWASGERGHAMGWNVVQPKAVAKQRREYLGSVRVTRSCQSRDGLSVRHLSRWSTQNPRPFLLHSTQVHDVCECECKPHVSTTWGQQKQVLNATLTCWFY